MIKFLIVAVSAALVNLSAHAAQTVALRRADANDFKATTLRPAPIADWQNQQRDAVRVTLPLEQDNALQLHAKPEAIESRAFWRELSGAELNKGVSVPISGEEALLQISPISSSGADAIDVQQLLIDQYSATEKAVVEYAAQAKQAGDFSAHPGSLQLKLSKATTNRAIELRTTVVLKKDARYLLHVQEKNSPFVLHAQHDHETVLNSQSLRSVAELRKADQRIAITTSKATLIAPDGRRFALNSVNNDRQQKLDQLMEFPVSDKPGLWEVEWQINARDNGVDVQRNVRTAFHYGHATARWGKSVQIEQDAQQWTLTWPLETVSAGRYELRAIAAKRERNGQLTPIALVSSAQWLETGKQQLPLTIDKRVLHDNGFSGDIVLLDTRLYDQTRMTVLQKQAQTLSLKNTAVTERKDR